MACAAALVALEICSDAALLQSVVTLGERFAAALRELPFVSAVRGRGLLVGVELGPEVSAIDLARRALTEERLVINATGPSSLRMEPPLIVTQDQIDEAVDRIGRLVR